MSPCRPWWASFPGPSSCPFAPCSSPSPLPLRKNTPPLRILCHKCVPFVSCFHPPLLACACFAPLTFCVPVCAFVLAYALIATVQQQQPQQQVVWNSLRFAAGKSKQVNKSQVRFSLLLLSLFRFSSPCTPFLLFSSLSIPCVFLSSCPRFSPSSALVTP